MHLYENTPIQIYRKIHLQKRKKKKKKKIRKKNSDIFHQNFYLNFFFPFFLVYLNRHVFVILGKFSYYVYHGIKCGLDEAILIRTNILFFCRRSENILK